MEFDELEEMDEDKLEYLPEKTSKKYNLKLI